MSPWAVREIGGNVCVMRADAEGWYEAWAKCSSETMAKKIAAALNAQESQLTRGIYPPITESIEAGPFVETVDVKPFDPDAGPAGRVEVSREELEKLYPSSSRADAEDSF